MCMKEYMYPYLEKTLKQEKSEHAEKSIAKDCSTKFYDILNTAPYRKVDKNN